MNEGLLNNCGDDCFIRYSQRQEKGTLVKFSDRMISFFAACAVPPFRKEKGPPRLRWGAFFDLNKEAT